MSQQIAVDRRKVIRVGRLIAYVRFRSYTPGEVYHGSAGDLIFGVDRHTSWGRFYFARPVSNPHFYFRYLTDDRVRWLAPLELLAAALPDWLAEQIGAEDVYLDGKLLDMSSDM